MASEPVEIRRVGGDRRVHAADLRHDGVRWHLQSFDGCYVLIVLRTEAAGAGAEMSVPVEVLDLAARLAHLDQPLAAAALVQKAEGDR